MRLYLAASVRRVGIGPPSASSIHILQARVCPLIIDGIAASTKAYDNLTP